MSTVAGFTGSVPNYYDRYLGPFLFEPYAIDLVRRLANRQPARVLEIACGTGIVTRRLRAALPRSTTVVATDLNAAMLEYAQAAVPDEGIQWQTADAQLLPYDDEAFDVVVCQFGFMFLPDKIAGLREARRVLTPGGLLLASVWHSLDENAYAGAMHRRLEDLFPADPPRFLLTPYGYDVDQLRADVAHAEWGEIRLEAVRLPGVSPSAVDIATGFVRGSPLSHQLADRGADEDEVVAELAEAISPGDRQRPFTTPLAATVLTARR